MRKILLLVAMLATLFVVVNTLKTNEIVNAQTGGEIVSTVEDVVQRFEDKVSGAMQDGTTDEDTTNDLDLSERECAYTVLKLDGAWEPSCGTLVLVAAGACNMATMNEYTAQDILEAMRDSEGKVPAEVTDRTTRIVAHLACNNIATQIGL